MRLRFFSAASRVRSGGGGHAMNATEWLTLGLLLVTGVYAALTYWLARTTAKQVWENNRAIVVATLSLHQGGNMLHLVIKNVGRGPARRCRLSVDCDVHSTLAKEALRETVAFKRPIESLPPEFAWHYALGQPHIWLKSEEREKFPMLFTVSAEYESGGKLISEKHSIDLEALLYGPMIRDDSSKFYFEMPQKYERQSNSLNRAMVRIADSVRGLRDHEKPVPYRSWSTAFRKASARPSR